MEEGKSDRILVISVDRDNDLGIKAGVEGPIIGKDKVIDAATKLGLKDPGDTDFNALFEAVRVFEELKRQYAAEVAVLTGDRDVGIKSDSRIKDQLEEALRKFHANFVVLISDGSEDEHIIPVIQSRIPILSVRRIVVKQSEHLESTYYKVKDFLKESLEDPKMARLVFGLPALALLLTAVFGAEGWRAVLGLLGAYLLVKGFRLEGYFNAAGEELRESFNRKRLSFFFYVIAILIGALAGYRGYTYMDEWVVIGIFETVSAFISASVYYFWAAGTMAWIGKVVGMKNRSFSRAVSVPMFGLAISLVLHNGTSMILEYTNNLYTFILAIVVGFILLFTAVYIEKK